MLNGQRLRIEPGTPHMDGVIKALENNQPFFFKGIKHDIKKAVRHGRYVYIDIVPLK